MQPNVPVGPEVPDKVFTQEALNKKFSYAFTRRQLISLIGLLRGVTPPPFGDPRVLQVAELLDEINRTAIQSITDSDYEKPEIPPANAVQTN